MNREIKFRAWDGEKIIPFDSVRFFIELDGTVWENTGDENGDSLEQRDIEIMQYTGLKDKNNIDIYESDKVICFLDGRQMDADDGIGFYNGSFWLKRRNISVESFLTNDGKYNTELLVYSNIHETKPQTIKQ